MNHGVLENSSMRQNGYVDKNVKKRKKGYLMTQRVW